MPERISRLVDSRESKGFSGEAFVLMGPPTSGKTSIGDDLYSSLGKDVVKVRGKDIVPERALQLSHYRQIVPDEEFIPAFLERMRNIASEKIVFENIPRTSLQAKVMVDWAVKENKHLNIVVLRLSEDQVIDRALNRLVCPHCDSTYHHSLKPSLIPGVCDRDGQSLQVKPGDKEEDLRRQYKEYLDNLSQIIPTLNSPKSSIYLLNSDGPVAEVSQEVTQLFVP